jgi:hypothetical protein
MPMLLVPVYWPPHFSLWLPLLSGLRWLDSLS